jgi:hypothetical protein
MELIMSAGLRKNFRMSRSMMAEMRWNFMRASMPSRTFIYL